MVYDVMLVRMTWYTDDSVKRYDADNNTTASFSSPLSLSISTAVITNAYQWARHVYSIIQHEYIMVLIDDC